MKFVPADVKYPFCSTMIAAGTTASHYVRGYEKSECGECGCMVSDESSDHMNIQNSGHAVLLCLPCAQTYKEFLALEKMVGA